MTHLEAAQVIGKVREVVLGGLHVDVEVLDIKSAYGRTRYLVSPVSGHGQVWVENIQ